MEISTPRFKVGKRGLDDKVLREIPGTLIEPDSKSDTLLFVQIGHTGAHSAYRKFFGDLLGEDFNVYLGQFRTRMPHYLKHSADDLFQIDAQLRDQLEVDKVFYIGHCTGMNAAVASVEKYNTDVKGLYGICAYPSLGDILTADANTDNNSLLQRLVDSAPALTVGLSYSPLKEANITNKVEFAIAENDLFLRTYKPEIVDRFETFFKNRFENCTVETFPEKNHSFNTHQRYLGFNKGDPNPLVDAVKTFVQDCIKPN